MTTSVKREQRMQNAMREGTPSGSASSRRLLHLPVVRELLIVLTFCGFTSVLTWPYITRLRDVVVDTGDPYLIAWILWWDYLSRDLQQSL